MTIFDSLPSIPQQERWRRQANPMPVVAAIIRRDKVVHPGQDPRNCYLLIKRIREPYAGRWALVGGKWDFGETLAQTAMREVKEETGLESSSVSLRGMVSERLAPAEEGNSDAAHFIIFVCQVEVSEGAAQEQEEGTVAWFTADDIERLNAQGAIIPSDYRMLADFTDTAALSYVEAEMLTMGGQEPGLSKAHLARFDHIG